jgi:hypothetical protein
MSFLQELESAMSQGSVESRQRALSYATDLLIAGRYTDDEIWMFGEVIGLSYMDYYNGTRTHLSLNKDAPISRAAEAAGRILCRPILGGLHHQYAPA